MFIGSSLTSVVDQRVAILLGDIKNPIFFKYFWQVVESLEAQGCKLTLIDVPIDVTGTGIRGTIFQQKLLRFSTEDLISIKSNFITQILSRPSNSVIVKSGLLNPKIREKYRKLSLNDVLSHPGLSELNKSSVVSTYQTKISKSIDLGVSSRRHMRDLARLVNSFIDTKEFLCQLEIQDSFDALVFLNGRQPHQAAFIEYARESRLDWYSVEHNPFESKFKSFHFEPFLPQDFKGIQQNYLRNRKPTHGGFALGRPDLENWFLNQRNFRPTFGPSKHMAHMKSSIENEITFVIFTSTLSEYDYILQQQDQSWTQFEAIEKVIMKIKSTYSNARIMVRIHPNQRNYSWHDLIELNKVLKNLEVEIFQPWDPITSYSILDSADYVVVWNSTIGLEAVFWGKKTVCLSSTFYNLILNLPQLSPENLDVFDFQVAAYPRPESAVDALGFMLFSGEEVKPMNHPDILDKIRPFSHLRGIKSSTLRAILLHLHYALDGKYVGPLARPVLLERLLTRLFTYKISISILNMSTKILSLSNPKN